jgi:hypothetical protein
MPNQNRDQAEQLIAEVLLISETLLAFGAPALETTSTTSPSVSLGITPLPLKGVDAIEHRV